jgi:thymidylate kinase
MSFIVVDGPNGTGKTSIIKRLKEKGYDTLSSPNSTPLAKMLRPVCRATEPWEDVDKRIKFMAFSCARIDEYLRCVQPAKHVVISDRWWTSTFVYQCVLEGLPVEFMEYTIHPQEEILCVIILTGESDVLISRVKSEREKNSDHGNCSWTQDEETMKRIGEIYLKELPEYLDKRKIRYNILDTTFLSMDEQLEKIEDIINDNIGLLLER